MTTTSKAVHGRGRVKFSLPLCPIPAPRPRVRVHNGVGYAYYAGKYKTFLAEAPEAIPESHVLFVKGEPVSVDVRFFLPKPANPANHYPVGDIDNYLKSILDAITKNGTYWHDDVQVTHLTAYKAYTAGTPRIEVCIEGSAEGHCFETADGRLEAMK